jgi:hypothetical protein
VDEALASVIEENYEHDDARGDNNVNANANANASPVKLDGEAGLFGSRQEDGDVAVHHSRHGDVCRVSRRVWISA